ncbi:TetR/AcrR family transcriptional regulator [Nordella sp. HKS 07]|uniref:TetR/AcrR family transcriptional regulator n=1 Tax=Nordella sp. HKS 07 TaxID=2712222 RepID=UPI0013E19BDD|nr:TetR/AcrR family transcriptional regulator [Nordella sp. HKS 07]QIG51467.1 TetR/AcrR family transcriptional regulator [Nordella sp. HKS 07]
MNRTYTLKRRADQQAQTRQRIVEAAVELHGSVGPAFTTISMVAERAGVQRHTYYAHFPTERDLLLACSGLAADRDPLPDAELWRSVADPRQRLQAGLGALYDWYARNAGLIGCVLRDAEHHALTKEVIQLRMGPPMAVYQDVLGQGLNARQRALLGLAFDFFTWRTLTRDSKLPRDEAVATMVQAIAAARSR